MSDKVSSFLKKQEQEFFGSSQGRKMKYVYAFSKEYCEGNVKMADLLGGKGANLAEMANLGLPVPPGFTIIQQACREFIRLEGNFPGGLWNEVLDHLGQVEKLMGKQFGNAEDPLLFSVRSGSTVSMPGMMDTVLNVGLNDQAVKGLAKIMNNERAAWDSYRRLIQMFGDVVLNVSHKLDRKSTRLNSSHTDISRMPSSA